MHFSKNTFESKVALCQFTIKKYQTDNSIFTSKANEDSLKDTQYTNRFAVGAHHHLVMYNAQLLLRFCTCASIGSTSSLLICSFLLQITLSASIVIFQQRQSWCSLLQKFSVVPRLVAIPFSVSAYLEVQYMFLILSYKTAKRSLHGSPNLEKDNLLAFLTSMRLLLG